jgi:hypothetical protein
MKKIEVKIEANSKFDLTAEEIAAIQEKVQRKMQTILEMYVMKFDSKKEIYNTKLERLEKIRIDKQKSEEERFKKLGGVKEIEIEVKNPKPKVILTKDMNAYQSSYYKTKVKSVEVTCVVCGTKHSKYSYKTHLSSKKHQKNLSNVKTENV